jgi:hypothetical protein
MDGCRVYNTKQTVSTASVGPSENGKGSILYSPAGRQGTIIQYQLVMIIILLLLLLLLIKMSQAFSCIARSLI